MQNSTEKKFTQTHADMRYKLSHFGAPLVTGFQDGAVKFGPIESEHVR